MNAGASASFVRQFRSRQENRMRASIRIALCGLAALLLVPCGAFAQQSANVGLAGLLPDLILRDIILPAPMGAVFSHSAHFSPLSGADVENPAVEIVESFNQLMTAQLASLPLGSSAGGFTYAFDPTLGTFRRTSRSFGPSFAERASTIGKGRFSVGFNYQHSSYDSFEGEDLRDGSIKFYLRHQECCSEGGPAGPPFFGVVPQPNGSRLAPFFEGDVIEAALTLRVKTDTFAAFANYGLTDRWDVALAVPFVHVDMNASVLATIQRLATSGTPQIHTFEAGNPNATQRRFDRSGSASGIGDIVVRTKYRVWGTSQTALALALDARLPTGNEDDLLGGSGQAKLFVIGSRGNDRLAEHVNIGYTFASGEGPNTGIVAPRGLADEFNYAGGVEFVATPRLTLLGDIVGRLLIDTGRLRVEDKQFAFELQGATSPSVATFQEFAARPGNLNVLLGTVGAKFNPIGDFLVSGSLLFPLNDSGLKSRWTTVIGIDYAF
jgi:hypothetical protein